MRNFSKMGSSTILDCSGGKKPSIDSLETIVFAISAVFPVDAILRGGKIVYLDESMTYKDRYGCASEE
jgi:hypothetical protein